MQSKTVSPLSILVASFLVALITVPSGPLRWYLTAAAIFVVSFVCYRLGERRQQAITQSPSDRKDGHSRVRFQFALRTLVAMVTLAAFVVAGIAWDHQLKEPETLGNRINDLMQADLSDYSPSLQVVSSGGSDGGSQDSAETHWSWALGPGSRISDEFLDLMARKIENRLCQIGAHIHGDASSAGGGDPTDERVPRSSGRDFSYQMGNIRGTVVLRLIFWGGPSRGGIVFLDHIQVR